MSSAASATAPTGTREAILGAGHKLLRSNKAFSMSSVAKLAGTSRQALYLHFADRYALLEAIVDQAGDEASVDDARARIASAKTGSEALKHFLEARVRVALSHGAIDQAVRTVLAADPKLARRWARRRGRQAVVRSIVERLAAEQALRPGLTAAACEATIEAFTSPELLVGLLASVPQAEAVDIVTRAVRAALLA